jgi:hypothetical protein
MFTKGQDACVVFDLTCKKPRHTALIAEWYRVHAQKIAMMRAMFDARPVRVMLKAVAARSGPH